MQEIEKRTGLLRILLADLTNKTVQLAEMESQYRAQLSRIVEFVVYREGDVANALSLMAEVQGKLDEVTQTAAHLRMIVTKGQTELEVLLLTKRVAEARSQLASLQERQQELADRLAQLSGADYFRIEEPQEQRAGSQEEVEKIRAVHEEVELEIARLNDLITDASERAARTIKVQRESEI